jgi:hypothetical protein
MNAMAHELSAASASTRTEPQLHSNISDQLPANHQLATRRVSCERCEAILHLQTNQCVRTWVESGRGNYCLYCFAVAVGELAPTATRLGGAECLLESFALGLEGRTLRSQAARENGWRPSLSST